MVSNNTEIAVAATEALEMVERSRRIATESAVRETSLLKMLEGAEWHGTRSKSWHGHTREYRPRVNNSYCTRVWDRLTFDIEVRRDRPTTRKAVYSLRIYVAPQPNDGLYIGGETARRLFETIRMRDMV